jgi:predicted CxxxxCH...CXXCH cytochrome family protein
MKQLALLVLVACSAERAQPDGMPASGVHPAGYADEKSQNFHAKDIPLRGYDLNLCAKCHGSDFAGGEAGVTCLKCHPQGPTACVTCHRDGPTSNAHVVHREVGKLACAECHVVPERWDAPGHVLGDDPPAEVTFGARANLTLAAGDRKGPATYADGTCTNVYCHGAALHAGGGAATEPRWDAQTAPGGCTGCHAAPPPSHAQSACATCHPASAPHIDGVVDIGAASGCSGCHGDATSPAPPNDLAGNIYTTALGVGAHRAHLAAPSHLRGPIACATCHLVPATVDAPGHIDSALPAEVDASLGWDRTTATCATAWCHGPARPVWTQSQGVACGSCHGVPPADAAHTPGMPLTTCASCHPRTMSPDGNLLPGEHMDGDVDVL